MRWDDPSDIALSPTSDSFYPDLKVEPHSPTSIMGGLELQGSGVGQSQNQNAASSSNVNNHGMATDQEAAVFGEDPITEEPLFQTPNAIISPPMTEAPLRDGLYSTPLSWTRPAPGRRSSSHTHSNAAYNGVLSPQQESKLRDIAMPNQQSQGSGYPNSHSSTSSPEPDQSTTGSSNNRRKRKSSIDDEEEEEEEEEQRNGRHPPVKKTAHNMIEKRYRTNLNDKIAALRDSVPSLRVMSKKNSRGEDLGGVQEDLQGLTPAHKLNKVNTPSLALPPPFFHLQIFRRWEFRKIGR
jgi:hypothetical protein